MVLAMYVVTPCTSRSADVKGKNIDAVNSRSKTPATHHTGQRRGLGLFATREEARYYGLNRRSSCRL